MLFHFFCFDRKDRLYLNKFRSKTKTGVERLQTKLNTLLKGKIVPLSIDGVVGPFTRAAINMSC